MAPSFSKPSKGRGPSVRTMQRNKRKHERGDEVVLQSERARAREKPRTDEAKRRARSKSRDANRKGRSGTGRKVEDEQRAQEPYPPAFEDKLQRAILELFYRKLEVQTGSHRRYEKFDNLRTLFGLILEREWESFPADQQDGKTPPKPGKHNGKVIWRSERFQQILAERYMEEHENNIWVLKEEHHPTIEENSLKGYDYGKKQELIHKEIVDLVCSEPTDYE